MIFLNLFWFCFFLRLDSFFKRLIDKTALRKLSSTEINELQMSSVCDHDVLEFDVGVDDGAGVEVGEAVEELPQDLYNFLFLKNFKFSKRENF